MRKASRKRSRGPRPKPRAWYVLNKFGIIQLNFKRSRKRYGKVTLATLLNRSLQDSFIRSLLILRSELTTTEERQELNRRIQRTRTVKSLTSAYYLWRRTCLEFSKTTP